MARCTSKQVETIVCLVDTSVTDGIWCILAPKRRNDHNNEITEVHNGLAIEFERKLTFPKLGRTSSHLSILILRLLLPFFFFCCQCEPRKCFGFAVSFFLFVSVNLGSSLLMSPEFSRCYTYPLVFFKRLSLHLLFRLLSVNTFLNIGVCV